MHINSPKANRDIARMRAEAPNLRENGNGSSASEPPARQLASVYVPPRAFAYKINDLLKTALLFPGRRARFARWAARLIPRGHTFLVAVFGGFVDRATYNQRQVICSACPDRRLHIPEKRAKRIHLHCGSCGCPKWPLSRMSVKNWLRRAYCPKKRHAGTYPGEYYVQLVQAERERQAGPALLEAASENDG